MCRSLQQVVGSNYQALEAPNNSTYIGSGKVAEVARAVTALKVGRGGICSRRRCSVAVVGRINGRHHRQELHLWAVAEHAAARHHRQDPQYI